MVDMVAATTNSRALNLRSSMDQGDTNAPLMDIEHATIDQVVVVLAN